MAGANNPLAEFMAKAQKDQDESKWVRGGLVGGAGYVSPLTYTTSNNTAGASYMAASSVSG
jgi:hypothetical protein